jgi:chemosensory pili system protein ChpA (sensor histidine kinase/response regulator)
MNMLHDMSDEADAVDDLSTLAWVHDELRRSLESAHKSLRRYLKEAETVSGSDVDAVDPSVLRAARAQLHQGVGALEMIGLLGPARVLRASENAVQRFIARPKLMTRAAVEAIESASFGVLDYLSRKLAGKGMPTLALFPQYRALQEWAGADRVHPADLWRDDWAWQALGPDAHAAPIQADPAARSAMETQVLAIMRGGDRAAMQRLSDLCAGLGAASQGRLADLWKLSAAFYEAQATGLLQPDVYAKRVSSRLLAQLRLSIAGQTEVSDRLAQDVLFFCAQARAPGDARPSPRLEAVREAYEIDAGAAIDYQAVRLGRFDPAWIAQARKRVAGAKEVWSAVAGGEAHRQSGLAEQFALVSDSLKRLYPSGEVLADALQAAVNQTVATKQTPRPALAMEVATSVLYLDASLEDSDFDHPLIGKRVQRLAQRIRDVSEGREAQPLEPWMEELYRRVSDRQTMGSVVQELRVSLSDVEKQIDLYFRNPAQRDVLIPVPGQLQAMRGVLSVLDMDQASHAVLRMSEDVDALASTEVDPKNAATGTFMRLADNLGALSFMIDMLSVQPQMARSLFRYDPETGNLSAVMGRRTQRLSAFGGFDELKPGAPPPLVDQAQSLALAAAQSDVADETVQRELSRLSQQALLADQRALAETMASAQQALQRATDDEQRQAVRSELAQAVADLAVPAAAEPPAVQQVARTTPAPQPEVQGSTGLEEDEEMREVFIDEAREVIQGADEALQRLGQTPDDLGDLTLIRRAFHTLKGSSRMVGLKVFGEAAWACEQLYNTRLAETSRLENDLSAFTADALRELGEWVEAIADSRAQGRDGAALSARADALRHRTSLDLAPTVGAAPLHSAQATAALLQRVPELPSAADLQLDFGVPVDGAAAQAPAFASPASPFGVRLDLRQDDTTATQTPDALPDLLSLELPADAPDRALLLNLDLASDPGVESLRLDPSLDWHEPVAAGESAAVEISEADIDAELGAMDPAAPAAVADDLELEAEDHRAQMRADVVTPIAVEAADFADTSIDLAELDEVPGALAGFDAPITEPLPLDSHTEPQALDEADAPPADHEQVKVIGDLRIGIPLFNIFLNEADELSRRLCVELAEWAMESERPLEESAAALAHSLAGSSATVGYVELSALARSLEHALMRSIAFGRATPGEPQLFNDAAEEIRRLLHQFAAGFLRQAPAPLMQRLQEHELALSALAPSIEPEEVEAEPVAPPRHDSIDLADSAAAAGVEPEAPQDETVATIEELPAPVVFSDELGQPALTSFAELPELEPSRTRVREDAPDDDDDIDATDQIDDELFPIFREEGEELLPQLQSRMRDWARRPADGEAAAACMRTLHTFKGGARLAGAMRLGEMAHRLETAIEHLLSKGHAGTAEVEILLGRVDAISSAFELLDKPGEGSAEVTSAAPPPADLEPETELPAEVRNLDVSVQTVSPPDLTPAQPAPARARRADLPSAEVAPIDWSRFKGGPAAPMPAADKPVASTAAVRVRAPLLDRLVNQAGEVSITRARIESDVGQIKGSLGDLTENLERLRRQLRDLELQAESQIASRMEAAKAASQQFDPLEMDRFTRFQELTRMMAESVNDVATVQRGLQRSLQATEDELAAQARLTRDLQDDLLRTRMVEFESMADRLYRVVRQAAKETGKQVRLDIVGGSIEVDRGVLDRMTGPFEHLLRNSVAHGIERPDTRTAAGKEATGTISIHLAQEGNEVAVEFRDDGAGLNLARIRERAVAMGLLAADAPASDAELANMIFAPGFSTADSVSELSGRGVGMDVVRAEVNAMGGRIETATAAGQGASFRLVLPLTTAVTQVVMLRCGELSIAVPSTLVELVRRVSSDEIEQSYASGAFALGDKLLPFFWLGALLQTGGRGSSAGRSQPVVVIRSASQRVALHVDDVLGNQEVVVKNLGPQLSRLPGLAGITLLPSGAVALIYNPVALATLYGEGAREQVRRVDGGDVVEVPVPVVTQPPLVLVVDDSLTVRRVTQRLLSREGYRVKLAKDGLDALDKLREELPAVVLSDIEMPRMDGFDLVRNMRSDARLAALPVIMITSRIAQKHRDYAAQLGVKHYLGKPYSEEELLALVGRHVQAAAAL